jgi:mono/diheme cytochrome c family protein
MDIRMKHNWEQRQWLRWLVGTAGLFVVLALLAGWLNVRGEMPLDSNAPDTAAPDGLTVERGAYLARAGNCMGCHSTEGAQEYAGGLRMETPFGTVVTPNITPDPTTGIGSWSTAEFWRAMHHGRSQDGRLLYPAFPYPSYTLVTREDSDALYAYLRTVKPVVQANKAHALAFPYNTQAALAVWRALFFRPGTLTPEPQKTAEWNRGRYLVDGLAHCAACHSSRNALGATGLNGEFAGGLMPDETWYAPSLASPDEAGFQKWSRAEAVNLLKNGVARHATVSGPMAEVVYNSTQHLTESDLKAMVEYLASLPVRDGGKSEAPRASSNVLGRGAKIYEQQCVACHGNKGQGVASIYPALAGNRAVLLISPNNLVQIIRKGGFSPSTAGNPQPFGMPPFTQILNNDDIAAVSTFVRQSWGNAAPPVSALDVHLVK